MNAPQTPIGAGPARRVRAVLLAVLVLLAPAPAAAAQDVLESVAGALRSDPVYVDPDAELADQVDAGALRARIRSAGAAPMFVAVLPESASGSSPGRTLVALREATGEPGTYVLVVGSELRALSDVFDGAAEAGDAARAAHPDDLQAALEDLAGRAGRESADSRSSGIGGAVAAFLVAAVVVLAAAGGVFALVGRRRRRRERGARAARLEREVRADFVRLGDAIRALEIDAELVDAGTDVRADYDRALAAYERANALDRKRDLAATDAALQEGLHAMAAARERLAGRRPASPGP